MRDQVSLKQIHHHALKDLSEVLEQKKIITLKKV